MPTPDPDPPLWKSGEGVVLLLFTVVVLAYAVLFFTRPSFSVERSQARRWSPAVGTLAGAMQGAVGISGAASEDDELCAKAGIEAIGLTVDLD